VVNGPDMRVGPNYGHKVAYTANNDPSKPLGMNEYRINYTNIPNADLTQPDAYLKDPQLMGVLTFRRQTAVTNAADPHVLPTMDNNGQPPYQIHVRYKMQNNFLSDTVKADYLTRQLMSFTLGVRLYEFNSGQPQQVSVTQKVTMGNLQR